MDLIKRPHQSIITKLILTVLEELYTALTAVTTADEELALLGGQLAASERDVLGHALLNMSAYLHDLAGAATAIAAGDLHQEVQPKTDCDVLGNAFHSMAVQAEFTGF